MEFSIFLVKFDKGLKQSGNAASRLMGGQKLSKELPQEITNQMGQYGLAQLDAAGQRTDINNLASGLKEMGDATAAFAEAGAEDACKKGQVLGDATQIAGIFTGNPLGIAVGEVISDVSGVGLTLLGDQSSEQKTNELLYDAGKRMVLGSWQGLLNKFEKVGDMPKAANNVWRGVNYTFNKISDLVKGVVEKNKDDEESTK